MFAGLAFATQLLVTLVWNLAAHSTLRVAPGAGIVTAIAIAWLARAFLRDGSRT